MSNGNNLSKVQQEISHFKGATDAIQSLLSDCPENINKAIVENLKTHEMNVINAMRDQHYDEPRIDCFQLWCDALIEDMVGRIPLEPHMSQVKSDVIFDASMYYLREHVLKHY